MTLMLSAALGCGNDARRAPPPSDDDPQLARESKLWEQVRSDGDWAEYKPTLSELADSADALVVARLVSVEAGRVVEGDGSGGVYSELLVNAEVTDTLRDSTADARVSFSLSLLSVTSLAGRDEALAAAQAALPVEQVLLLLRERDDEDHYRVVNGYGLWASTTRSPIDAPLELEAPLGREEHFVYARELSGLGTIEQLIDSLR